MSAKTTTEFEAVRAESNRMRQVVAQLNAQLTGIQNNYQAASRPPGNPTAVNRAEEQYAELRETIKQQSEAAQKTFQQEQPLLKSKYEGERAVIEVTLKEKEKARDEAAAALRRLSREYDEEFERCRKPLEPVETFWLNRSEFLETSLREAGKLRIRVNRPSLGEF
jgi:hypothetical protein